MAEPFLTGARVYPSQGVNARRVTLDGQGFVWVSGTRGTFRFDGVRYLPAARFGLPADPETRVAVTSDGTIWAQSNGGLYRLEANRFQKVREIGLELQPLAAAGELLYVPLAGGGLEVWYRRAGGWTSARTGQGPLPLQHLHGEADGRVWFGNLAAGRWVRWREGRFEFGEGRLLPGTLTGESVTGAPLGSRALGGDSRDFRFEVCGVWGSATAPAMSLPEVRELLPDFSGGVWGAAGEAGLRYAGRGSAVKVISHERDADRPVRDVTRQGERLYVARIDAVAVLEPGKTARLCDGTDSRERLLRPWGTGRMMAPYLAVETAPDGSVWVLTRYQGAVHLDADGSWKEAVPQLTADPQVFSMMWKMAFSADGRLWIASKRNLIEVVTQPELRYRPVFPNRQPYRYAAGFVRDREGGLYAIAEGGLLRYGNGAWEEQAWPACLASPRVRTMAIASENEQWIGYRDRNVLTRATRANGGAWQCEHFDETNGFPGDTQFLAIDRQRRLWRGSDAGLFFARGTPQTAADWVRLGAGAGIPAGEMRQVFSEEPDGAVLVAIGDRLVRIPPRLLEAEPGVPPQLSYLDAEGRWELNPRAVAVRKGEGAQLYLSALPERELAAASPIEYRFDDGAWRTLRGHRLALDESPEGAARIEFRYAGAARVLAVPLRLAVPWWLTGWFRAAAVIGGSGALAGLTFWVMRAMRRRRFQASKRRFLENQAQRAVEPWAAGTILRGGYRVESLLARGGFSDVFAAVAPDGRRVVVKRLRQGDLPVDRLRRRFTQEVAAVSMIRHPGVLPILETWIDEDGVPHLVLERVEGPTLRQRLNQGLLPRDEARGLLRDLADILAAAHAQGVVHSDLKPENILLMEGGRPVLIDFGTSALHLQAPLSEYSRPAGSLQYMAPEQLLGRYSPATDLYAFAVVAFEVLTGRRYAELRLPFDERWEEELRNEFASSGLGAAAAAVFSDGLRFDPQQRAQDLSAWYARLAAVL